MTRQELSDMLKAMANEVRLSILCELCAGERSVSQLGQALGVRQSSLSQQLGRLRAERLVIARREGKRVYYRISSDACRKVVELLCCGGRAGRGARPQQRGGEARRSSSAAFMAA